MYKKFFLLMGLMVMSMMLPAGFAQAKPESTSAAYNLKIMHPHSTDFYDWVVDDFKVWFAQEYPSDTLTVTELAQAGSSAGPTQIKTWNGSGVDADILWGGGRFEFNSLRDYTYGNLLAPYRAAEHNNYTAFLGGWDMWDSNAVGCGASICTEDPSWYAAAISGFGFMYNTEVLSAKSLPTPATWDDLTKYDYFGEIVMANPSASGSTTATVLQMLQHKTSEHSENAITYSSDSTEAWEFWAKVAGNVGEYTSSSSTPPTKVAEGEYAIGLVIDYFAYDRMANFPVGFSYGGATTVSPDPVAKIADAVDSTTAVNDLAADAFMDYVTGTRGQSRVGKYRTPANFQASSNFPVPTAYNSTGFPTSSFPAISPFNPDIDGGIFSRARSLFDNWFVQNIVKQKQAWTAINTATYNVAKANALDLYLTLPSTFNGSLQSLRDQQYSNTTVTTLWTTEGAANFDAAKAEAAKTAPPGSTTAPGTVTNTKTVTESAVSGFELLFIIPIIIAMGIIRRKK